MFNTPTSLESRIFIYLICILSSLDIFTHASLHTHTHTQIHTKQIICLFTTIFENTTVYVVCKLVHFFHCPNCNSSTSMCCQEMIANKAQIPSTVTDFLQKKKLTFLLYQEKIERFNFHWCMCLHGGNQSAVRRRKI